jgi:D-arabinose 1-dehydrogenase-like Zn-dependent alcohol dehydrogenase
MAELMLVPDARHLVPLPDSLEPVEAAPLTDAGLAPYHAVRRSLPRLYPGATAVARPLGDLTIIGTAGGALPVSFFSVPYELSVQTTYWGSRPELEEVLNLAGRGLVRATTTTYPLEQAAEAYRLLEAGEITGRAVVVPALRRPVHDVPAF